jgi:hypothetical protein
MKHINIRDSIEKKLEPCLKGKVQRLIIFLKQSKY